jgi:transposase-like protein
MDDVDEAKMDALTIWSRGKSLSEDFRKAVLRLYYTDQARPLHQRLGKSGIGKLFGIHPNTVYKWVVAFEQEGRSAAKSRGEIQ